MVFEKFQPLFDRHLQHIGNGLAFVVHLQRFVIVAMPMAHFAGNVDIRQKVHLHLDRTVALACLAAAALHIEGKTPLIEAANFRLIGLRKHIADEIKHLRVGGRIGTRRAPNRRLINFNHFVELLIATNGAIRARTQVRLIQAIGEHFIENSLHKRTLAGARHARNARQHAQW